MTEKFSQMDRTNFLADYVRILVTSGNQQIILLSIKERKPHMDLLIKHLGKKYIDDIWGLKEFSLQLKPGILGLLGPNRAGREITQTGF